MSEEEKEAIEQLESWREFIIKNKDKVNKANDIEFYIRIVLNLIQKQEAEIEKIKNKNKELLRKLKNRVKEVKKMTKYSLYKKEFSRLNVTIEKKNKIIDEMTDRIEWLLKSNGIYLDFEHKDKFTQDDIKQYFERKVEQC